jgi:hypothetical protein
METAEADRDLPGKILRESCSTLPFPGIWLSAEKAGHFRNSTFPSSSTAMFIDFAMARW